MYGRRNAYDSLVASLRGLTKKRFQLTAIRRSGFIAYLVVAMIQAILLVVGIALVKP